MNKPFTPAQRVAYRYPNLNAMGDALVPVPAGDLAALLDAADERDRLAVDLEAMRERLAQGATLPQPPTPPPAPIVIEDPGLYARMSRPRPAAEVSAAYNAFWQDVSAARERHGIRDVVIVSTVAVSYDEGEPMAELRVGYRGDSTLVVPLLARALGGMRRDSERRLDDLAAGRDEEG